MQVPQGLGEGDSGVNGETVHPRPFVVPWVEHSYGLGIAMHVLAGIFATGTLPRRVRERARARDREMRCTRVTAVITEVEPLPAEGEGVESPGHTITLEFTGPDGERRRMRDTSGLGGHSLALGAQVVGHITPPSPENLEVLKVVGPKDRFPIIPLLSR